MIEAKSVPALPKKYFTPSARSNSRYAWAVFSTEMVLRVDIYSYCRFRCPLPLRERDRVRGRMAEAQPRQPSPQPSPTQLEREKRVMDVLVHDHTARHLTFFHPLEGGVDLL